MPGYYQDSRPVIEWVTPQSTYLHQQDLQGLGLSILMHLPGEPSQHIYQPQPNTGGFAVTGAEVAGD